MAGRSTHPLGCSWPRLDSTVHQALKEEARNITNLTYAEVNEERIFAENLLQQRFNFFVAVFSLIVVAGTSADTRSELYFVLAVGFVLCLLLGLAVYRIFVKVDAILVEIHKFEASAPHVLGSRGVKSWPLSIRANDILGYVIPLFALVVIAAWAVLTFLQVVAV